MRVLVTGSEGLIGRELVAQLEQRRHSVTRLDLVLGVDVSDTRTLSDYLNQCEAVVHLASPSSSILFDRDPIICWDETLVPLSFILKTFRGRVIIPSSCTVYGNRAGTYAESAWLPDTGSIYARAKRESERIGLAARIEGHDVRICRIFTGYGSGEDHKIGYASLPYRVVSSIVSRQSLRVFGRGEQTRDFIHVSDVAKAICVMLEAPECPAIVNLGTGRSTSVNDLIAIAERVTGRRLAVEHVDLPRGYAQVVKADMSLAESCLGITSCASLEMGVRSIFEHLDGRY